MGTRQDVVYPFLGLLERVFFPSARPKLEEGLFLAAWVLDYAVGLDTRPTARLAVLGQEVPDMPLTARLLGAEERSDLLARVRAAEKHLATYRAHFSGDSR